MIAFSLVIQAR